MFNWHTLQNTLLTFVPRTEEMIASSCPTPVSLNESICLSQIIFAISQKDKKVINVSFNKEKVNRLVGKYIS